MGPLYLGAVETGCPIANLGSALRVCMLLRTSFGTLGYSDGLFGPWVIKGVIDAFRVIGP